MCILLIQIKYFFRMGRPRIHSSKSVSNKEYCKQDRQKNKKNNRKSERQRKKQPGEYKKYLCPKKYQERLENYRIRAREYSQRKNAEKKNESLESTTTTPSPSPLCLLRILLRPHHNHLMIKVLLAQNS